MKRTLSDTERARWNELLVQGTTEQLDDKARAELARLDPDSEPDQLELELAAAAADLATLTVEPMPREVAARIRAAAPHGQASSTAPAVPAVAAPHGQASSTAPAVPAVAAPWPERIAAKELAPAPPSRPRARWFAWPVAVAAAAALAFTLGYAFPRGGTPSQGATAPIESRPEMMASRTTWQRALRALEPGSATGDVVWSSAQQGGYLRVTGLPANDPATARYQLWIFDRNRDERYPVDGGVFDVAAEGETVIPFRAKLPIADPVRVLVTREGPGGVVVSSRERQVLEAR